jgi:VWFA-related protein
MRMRNFLFLGATVIPVALACSQQPVSQIDTQTPGQPDSTVYTLHTTTREVNLDVVVTDAAGHPVHGLTRDNFRVLDEGQPQTLRGFDEHRGSTVPAAPEFKLPPNTFTNYVPAGNPEASIVILFDSLDTPIDDQSKAYVEVQDFLKDLAPGTSVAIFDLNERMNLVQGFTTDRVILLNALKDKRAQPKYSPLLGTGNETWRQQILNTGMLMLGRYLSGFPGRKNLIWFTVNIPGSFNSRTASIQAGAPPGSLAGAGIAVDTLAPPPITALQPDGVAGGDPRLPTTPTVAPNAVPTAPVPDRPPPALGNVSGNPFQYLTNLIDDSKSTSDVLTLSKVVVYPVDPRQLMTPFEMGANPGFRFEQAAMEDIADATGGHAFYNRNGLKSSMQEIVAKGSDFYTLTYSPTSTRWDGSYRKLKVQTVGEAPRTAGSAGLHLEYRPGYYAADHITSKLAQENGFAPQSTSGDDFRLVTELTPGKASAAELPKENLQASMTMGQIPPTELILNASVKPSASPLKLEKGETMPDGDFMRDKFKHQPYREYDVLFATDVHGLQLPRSPDGLHHGGVEFVAVVYTDQGDVVNSFSVKISLNLREESYRALLQNGLGKKHSIAIPIKGNYVVRLGVHDLNSDRMGALEFPLSSVNLAVAGVGQGGTP